MGRKNFFDDWNHPYQLEIIAVDHNVQNEKNHMSKSRDNEFRESGEYFLQLYFLILVPFFFSTPPGGSTSSLLVQFMNRLEKDIIAQLVVKGYKTQVFFKLVYLRKKAKTH